MDKINHWGKELELLQKILNKTELTETIKWGTTVYTHNGKNIVGFVGFKNYFTLWFYNGVFLTDPYKVLISAQEKTKALRQWRFNLMEEIDEKQILEYVKEAIKNSEEGKEIKAKKFQSVSVPELLQDELNLDENLKSAFEKLIPGKQKEYSLFIDEAKQEKTKMSRIEKIKPMILQGIGLYDKYKKD
ncbi:YdeI/OmpD-associated family protein [Moheibacter sediminis]|uniref:Uncharacterized conserved protein YdeI, YjbR/CyaY-like superfamily, DUF1801 family n=1 Tax=Moheibacter sediminis TaxID=1434700 RepID=A0A1W2AG78_9FLAO|nr:DUF1801 domain-containing protein [Moheibacter sediminis]SMC59634.1 Uncharacterized conserved protein YdeI, YjbR/CyaY-like superfamily, DUF1801 family [Moheibacter sediminis]